MKKALFSALAVIAIVSAALAFAPAKQHADIYTTNPDDNNNCNKITIWKKDQLGTVTLTGPYVSPSPLTTPCPDDAVIQARVDE